MYEIGDDDVGDDVESILSGEEIGADRPRAKSRIKTTKLTKSRVYLISLDSVATIAAAATQNVTAQPQVLFRPERLVIDPVVAPSFLLNSFTIGKNAQFAATGSVPAAMFTPTAVGVQLKLDTAQISALIVLNVTNTSAGALRFTAGLIGEAVE